MTAVQEREFGVTAVGRWLGVAAGLVAGGLLARWDSLGRGLLLAGPAFGIAVLSGVLLGELAAPGPHLGAARRALLETRRVGDYLPGWSRSVAVLTAVFVLVTVGTSLVGSADDRQRAGRAFARTCADGSVSSAGPWPGAYYAVPTLVAVLTGLGVAGLVLRRVVSRPRPAGMDVERDDRARRAAASATTAACAVLVAVPLAGSALIAGGALLTVCGGAGQPGIAWALLLLAGCAGIGACAALATLLSPRRPGV